MPPSFAGKLKQKFIFKIRIIHNINSIIMKIIVAILLLALLALTQTQQICLHQECQKELDACGPDCIVLMGKCVFSCTLSSIGCMQQCIGNNPAAQAMLDCSFNKCINL